MPSRKPESEPIVSGRDVWLPAILAWLEDNRLDPDEWLGGLAIDGRDEAVSLPWPVFTALCARLGEVAEKASPPRGLREVGREIGARVFRESDVRATVARATPLSLYRRHLPAWATRLDLVASLRAPRVRAGRLALHVTLRRPSPDDSALLALASGVLERLPLLLDAGDARVELEADTGTARFSVSLPKNGAAAADEVAAAAATTPAETGGASDIALILDESGELATASPPVDRAFGISLAPDPRQALDDHCHPDDRERFLSAWTRAREGKGADEIRFRILDDRGRTRWLSGDCRRLGPPSGSGWLVLLRDVTAQERLHAALRELERFPDEGDEPFRSLIESLALTVDADLAMLVRFDSGRRVAHTLAVAENGAAIENFAFDLDGTPCARLENDQACCVVAGVQREFPDDRSLADRGLEAYCGVPLRDAAGRVFGAIACGRRVPFDAPDECRSMMAVFARRAASEVERVRTERELRESRSKYRAIAENAGDLIIEIASDAGPVYVSPNVRELTGFAEDDVMRDGIIGLVVEGERERVESAFRRLIDDNARGDLTFRIRRRDGELRWIETTYNPFHTSEGDVHGVVVARDVTERIIAQEELEQLLSITENSTDLIALASLGGTLRFVNRAGRRLVGLGNDADVENTTLLELVADSEARDLRFEILPAVHRDGHWSGELTLRAVGDRPPTPTLAILFRVGDPSQRDATAIAAICQDIGDRKREEEALRERDVRYGMLAENPYDIISELSATGQFVYLSPNSENIVGYSPEVLLGRSAFDFVHPDDVDEVRAAFERAAETRDPQLVSYRFRHSDGDYRWLDTTGRVFEKADGRLMGFFISRDITERKLSEVELQRSEQRLRQAQKMESIGRLAGGVAHDFNNLLTAIVGYGDLLQGQLGGDHPAREEVDEILKAAERAGSLTRQLLAFSRRQFLHPKVIDLNRLVADLDRMLRRLIGEDIEYSSVLEGELWPVKADAGQLEQVLLNLVVNARDAMPGGGRIKVETANRTVALRDIDGGDPIEPGDYVTVSVRDTGIGMEPETAALIFEPFFTTKESEKGTGLGLSTAYGIVKQSGGHIRVNSRPGAGSTFTVYLPRCHSRMAGAELPADRGRLTGEETILVVEDSDAVRKLVCRHLTHHGYAVLEASSVSEVQRLCREHGNEIDLLLTDVIMPRVNGPTIARHVNESLPGTPLVYMSGFSDDALSRHGIVPGEVVLLQKPFTQAELLSTLREQLDAHDRPNRRRRTPQPPHATS